MPISAIWGREHQPNLQIQRPVAPGLEPAGGINADIIPNKGQVLQMPVRTGTLSFELEPVPDLGIVEHKGAKVHVPDHQPQRKVDAG